MLVHEAELSLEANLLMVTVQSCWLSMTAVTLFFHIKRRIPHYIFWMSSIGLDSTKYICSFSVKWQWIMSCKYCSKCNSIALSQQKKNKQTKEGQVWCVDKTMLQSMAPTFHATHKLCVNVETTETHGLCCTINLFWTINYQASQKCARWLVCGKMA